MKISEYRGNPIVSKSPVLLEYVEKSSRGGEVTPESVLVAELASKIIKGIQFPKRGGGAGRTLSSSDCEEVISIVAYTLSIRGVFEKGGEYSKLDFRACRKAVRASDKGLSLYRSTTSDLSQVIGWKAAKDEAEKGERKVSLKERERILSRYAYLKQCIAMACYIDKINGAAKGNWKAYRASILLELAKKEALEGFAGTISLPRKWRANTKPNQSPEDKLKETTRAKQTRKDAKAFFLEYVNVGHKAIQAL